MLGVAISTVAGKLRMDLRSGVGSHTAFTASHISTAKSSSVPVKLSGLYWKIHSEPRSRSAYSRTAVAPRRAIYDACTVGAEHDTPLSDRGGVVYVNDGAPRAAQGFIGPGNQLGTGLGQHLDRHIVGYQALLDDFAHEIEVCLRGGGKSHFDFLEADFDQHVEHAAFAGGIHRFDQRLIAIAEIDAAPDGGYLDDLARPCSIGKVDGFEGLILGRRITQHGFLSIGFCAPQMTPFGKIEAPFSIDSGLVSADR
jgi:hypothetical protein